MNFITPKNLLVKHHILPNFRTFIIDFCNESFDKLKFLLLIKTISGKIHYSK